MTTHPLPDTGLSQCDIILARLVSTPGQWVPMPALCRLSGSFNIHSRIADLRRRGHRIDHQNRQTGRKIHSFYRLADSSDI
jgi:hypothetical protein